MKTANKYPVGLQFDVAYPMFNVSLTIEGSDKLSFEIKEGPFQRKETVNIEVIDLGNNLFAVSWVEKDGASVVNLQDFDEMIVLSFASLPDGQFLRNKGTISVRDGESALNDERPKRNSKIVLDAMTSLFQRRDVSAVDRLYNDDYRQHNQDMPQGREALRKIVSTLDSHVFYEPGMMFAVGDKVAIHGRIHGWGPKPQVVVDMFRISDGKLAEHWDVLQEEIPGGEFPMFDPNEGK